MKTMRLRRVIPMTVALVLILVTGCSQASPEAARGLPPAGVGLSAEHSGALDVLSQLALGMLKLEETADAVTEAQAAELLPLWQTLQGSALQGVDETAVVQKQIEKTLTETQLSSIKVMQLTEDDAQAWADEAGDAMGPAGGFFGGAGGGARPNGGVVPAGSSQQLMVAVVRLLVERSGQEIAFARPQGARPGVVNDIEEAGEAAEDAPTATPQLTATLTPEPAESADRSADAGTADDGPVEGSADLSADEPTAEPAATSTPTEDAVADADAESVSGNASEPELEDVAVEEIPVVATESVVEPAAALVQVPDTNPGPPFSVEISLNRAEPSPLLDGVTIYKVSGLLRTTATRSML